MALKTFDDMWTWLASVQGCGDPVLRDSGQRCLSERDRGGQFDWFAAYRDPIANDPAVREDSAGLADALNPLTNLTGWQFEPLPAIAVLLIAVGVFL